MVGGEAAAAVEELVSGVRQAADFAEQFRSYSESEKQWKARMEFILRHLPDYRDPPDGGGRLDQLLSLSMVWANHLFLGCSYNKDLLDKVMEMADGIEVEDLPQFTTRSELMKKECGWSNVDTIAVLYPVGSDLRRWILYTSKLSQKIYHIFIISYRIRQEAGMNVT
ncbi:PREDICTED: CDKN2AIP N-terminal-like protein isoform X1 [Cercocebus atys]|uniref:CDKN2AIP N-terminal-like protein isoform X1 n=1 Tax=Cercocebus atys TaxID=9531 RepID=UPI0005F46E2C|nr:PREDICTED: CDKN2AIP N-terminal-like protein isoform X1 [Cercocebus atys]